MTLQENPLLQHLLEDTLKKNAGIRVQGRFTYHPAIIELALQLEQDMSSDRYDVFVSTWGLGLPCSKTLHRMHRYNAAGPRNTPELYRGFKHALVNTLKRHGVSIPEDGRIPEKYLQFVLAEDELNIRGKIVMSADGRTPMGLVDGDSWGFLRDVDSVDRLMEMAGTDTLAEEMIARDGVGDKILQVVIIPFPGGVCLSILPLTC